MNIIKLLVIIGFVAWFITGIVGTVDSVLQSRNAKIEQILAQQ